MLRITVTQGEREYTAVIADEHAPAFKSAVEEIRNEIGSRLEGPHAFTKEAALTRASTALGQFAAALNAVVPNGDGDYA